MISEFIATKGWIAMRISVLLMLLILAATAFIGLSQKVYAQGACDSGDTSVSCVSENCRQIRQYINAATCDEAVKACENTYSFGNWKNYTFIWNDTNQGNCSNAIRSCYENLVDTKACTDKNVLATAAAGLCEDEYGNVSADGECGLDAAIDKVNKAGTGVTYDSNKGLKSAYTDQQVKDACGSTASVEEKRSCEALIEGRVDSCYKENGGSATKVDSAKIKDCMIKSATSEIQCKAAGGTPGMSSDQSTSDTGTCTNPDGDPNDPNNPNNNPDKEADCLKAADGKTCLSGITGATNKCGEAKTNIVGCSGTSEGALNDVLRIFVIVLSFGVGIAAVASIAYSAIRYAGARDNQSDVSLARERIRNVVIGLLLYGFLLAIANWLVPGGIL